MKKLIFILSFLLTFVLNAQIFDPPSGYTTPFGGNYGLRLYDYDDNPGSDSLNANFIDISEGFVKRAFEFQVNQIRTTNGTLLVSSSATLDTVLSATLLRFQDVTGRKQVPFTAGDVIFAQVIAQTGEGYDANGNIIDSEALIRRAVYQIDSVGSSNGLLVYVSAHVDAKVPSNKGSMSNGDVFVKIANVSSGVNLIEISSDLANSPRITWFKGLNNWSEYVSDTNKVVVIGNIGNLVTNSFGTVTSGTIGAYFNGGAGGGQIILDNVDINMSNQSSISIGGFGGTLDDIANGSTYGKIALTDISAGHILLASTVGDLDDIVDGSTYARILKTDISSGHILLEKGIGTIDDISDGTNYKRVASTDITAGHITVVSPQASININNATFGASGIQLQYNAGSPRMYVGNGSTTYMQYTGGALSVVGGTITGGTITSGIGTSSKIVLGDPSIGSMRFYWNGSEVGTFTATSTGVGFTGDGTSDFQLFGTGTDLQMASTQQITGVGVVDVVTGFRQGTMTAGRYLRSNGTNFVSNTIQAGDIPDLSGTYTTVSNVNTVAQGGTGRSSHTGGRVIVSNVGGTELGVSTTTSTEVQLLSGKTGLLNFRGELDSAPSSPASGHCYYNTSSGVFSIYTDDAGWVALN